MNKFHWSVMILCCVMIGAAPAPKPDQFDLKCTGEMRFSSSDPWQSTSSEYRVDLKNNQWCTGECTIVYKLASVDDRYISFEHEMTDTLTRKVTTLHGVSRETGAWSDFSMTEIPDHSYSEMRGHCDPAPFKGFPTPQAKF